MQAQLVNRCVAPPPPKNNEVIFSLVGGGGGESMSLKILASRNASALTFSHPRPNGPATTPNYYLLGFSAALAP